MKRETTDTRRHGLVAGAGMFGAAALAPAWLRVADAPAKVELTPAPNAQGREISPHLSRMIAVFNKELAHDANVRIALSRPARSVGLRRLAVPSITCTT